MKFYSFLLFLFFKLIVFWIGVKRPNNDNNPGGRKRQKCSVCGQEGSLLLDDLLF